MGVGHVGADVVCDGESEAPVVPAVTVAATCACACACATVAVVVSSSAVITTDGGNGGGVGGGDGGGAKCSRLFTIAHPLTPKPSATTAMTKVTTRLAIIVGQAQLSGASSWSLGALDGRR